MSSFSNRFYNQSADNLLLDTETTYEKVKKLKKYEEIENIEISSDIINKLVRLEKTSEFFAKKSEGYLYGRESPKQNKIFITSLIPCSFSDRNLETLNDLMNNSRMDFVNIGYFFSGEQNELTQQRLKLLIDFQREFPNAVFLFFDTTALQVNCYPFNFFRLSDEFMDRILIEEIEENVKINKETPKEIIKDFYKKLFKNMTPNMQLVKTLNFKIINDTNLLFSSLSCKKDTILHTPKEQEFQNTMEKNLMKNLRKLNKTCEKIISEQKKYINFYKNRQENQGKNEESNTIIANSEDKLDFIDIGLCRENLNKLKNNVNSLIKKQEIDSTLNFAISSVINN